MALVDPVSDALINIKNHDFASKRHCLLRPASKLMGEILRVLKDSGYVQAFEFVVDGREGIYKVDLAGKINDCKAVKPRYPVKKDGFEKFEKKYLPARGIGILIVTTPDGVMTHRQAKEKNLGGRLLGFVY